MPIQRAMTTIAGEFEAPPPSAVRHSITAFLQKETTSNNIKVVARFRPKNELELALDANKPDIVTFLNPTTMIVGEGKDKETISFDHIFAPDVSQESLFQSVGAPEVNEVLTGYNGTVFAYGQTGSGKTYSMMGTDLYDNTLKGIIPRAANKIFTYVEETEGDVEFILTCSMMEIYKEKLRDLLTEEQRYLKIKEDPRRGIYVQGLTELSVDSEIDMLDTIAIGDQMRTVGSTRCNAVSSRSHTIFILEIKQKFPNESEKRGILNLVDLAGSEKVHLSGVTGNAMDEAKKINLSLSALGNVIHALVGGSEHIPYRDSKLTRLLQESLGGNYKTTILVALSSSFRHFDETLNTIKFAQRAKKIRNKVSLNIKSSPEAYQKMIEKLTEQLQRANRDILVLSGNVVKGEMIDKAVNTDPTSSVQIVRRASDMTRSPQASQFSLVSLKVLKEMGETPNLTHHSDSSQSQESISYDRRLPQIDSDLSNSRGESYLLTTERGGNEISEEKYLRMKRKYRGKVKNLEATCSALTDERGIIKSQIEIIDKALQSSRKNLLAEKEEKMKYLKLYHQHLSMVNKDLDASALQQKQIESLKNQIKILTASLRETDERFGRFIEETERGKPSAVLEFADLCDEPEASQENSDGETSEVVRELPLESKTLAQSQLYSERLFQFLELNSFLSGELEAFQLRNQAEHLQKRIDKMETVVETIYNAHSSYCTLVDKLGGENTRSYADLSSPRARIVKPFSKATIQRKSARQNTVRPRIDMTKLRTSFADRASVVEIDSAGGMSSGNWRVKTMEINLQMQTNYNNGLKDGLMEKETELRQTQQFLDSLQAQIFRAHRQERERWQRFFEAFQSNCERELLRKQDEVANLNQLLSNWVTKFMNLQEQVGIPSGPSKHRRTLSKQYEEELKSLCETTSRNFGGGRDLIQRMRIVASQSPIRTGKAPTTRGVPIPTQVSAGDSPPQLEDDF